MTEQPSAGVADAIDLHKATSKLWTEDTLRWKLRLKAVIDIADSALDYLASADDFNLEAFLDEAKDELAEAKQWLEQ